MDDARSRQPNGLNLPQSVMNVLGVIGMAVTGAFILHGLLTLDYGRMAKAYGAMVVVETAWVLLSIMLGKSDRDS